MWQISFSHVTPLVVRHFPPTLLHCFDFPAVELVWLTRQRLVAVTAVRWTLEVVVGVVGGGGGGGSVCAGLRWHRVIV